MERVAAKWSGWRRNGAGGGEMERDGGKTERDGGKMERDGGKLATRGYSVRC